MLARFARVVGCRLSVVGWGCRVAELLSCWVALLSNHATQQPSNPTTDNAPQAPLIVVFVLLLVCRQRRIFEGHFLAGLEALHHFDAGVVREAGDDRPLVEELLPAVLV